MFNGVQEVLEAIKDKYLIGVLSANYLEEITQKLEKNGISDYFEFIIANKHIATEILNKSDKLKELMKKTIFLVMKLCILATEPLIMMKQVKPELSP